MPIRPYPHTGIRQDQYVRRPRDQESRRASESISGKVVEIDSPLMSLSENSDSCSSFFVNELPMISFHRKFETSSLYGEKAELFGRNGTLPFSSPRVRSVRYYCRPPMVTAQAQVHMPVVCREQPSSPPLCYKSFLMDSIQSPLEFVIKEPSHPTGHPTHIPHPSVLRSRHGSLGEPQFSVPELTCPPIPLYSCD